MSKSILSWALTGCLTLLAACGGGGGGNTTQPQNQPPVVHALASGDVRLENGSMHATLGGNVVLDASGSTDDHDVPTYVWTLVSAPSGSLVSAGGSTATTLTFKPDLLGDYVFDVKASDSEGASSTQRVTVTADNTAPVATIAVSATFTATAAQKPTLPVTVGGNVVLDATQSTDPDGDSVDVTFELAPPTGSASTLSVTGRVARFSPDVLGTFQVRVRGFDTRGASFETLYTFRADNRAPTPVTVANVQPVVADGGSALVTTSVGYDVLLDGTSSSDPDGNTITRSWVLASKPAGSVAILQGAADANSIGLAPDVLGDYVVVLTVTDSVGAQSRRTQTVRADNRRPVAVVSTNATPQSLPAAPSAKVPLGTQVTLRADASTDADGDALTDAWSIDSAPAGSQAALSSTTAVAPTFTADLEGSYVFRLRVTDTKGAFSERTVVLDVGTHAPVAVVDRGIMTVLAGAAAQASAALSFDEDGDTLTYQWSIDARPTGSSATLATTNSATVNFTPDIAGTYALAVRVDDGHSSSIAYVTVRALSAFQASVALNFVPGETHYSLGLDKLVVASTGPNALYVVDPFTGARSTVALPASVKNFGLSPDGRLAVVLHEGVVSLIDLVHGTLLRSTNTGGSQTDAFVTNAGIIYAIGQTGGQWVNEPVVVIDGRSGTKVIQAGSSSSGFAFFYGTQYGVLAGSMNKVFFVAQGLSPADISWFSFDPANSQVNSSGDSPYHGDYALNVPLWMSGDDSLVFTAAGTYFRSDNLRYAGRLSGVTNVIGFSHSASLQEALALSPTTANSYPYVVNYPSTYQTFTGALLFPGPSLAFPTIAGLQSYGLHIFHSAAGSHVALVQTGNPASDASGVNYYVIAR